METEQFILHENAWLPNNERLPVLLYRGVVEAERKKAAERFEWMFAYHGWPPQWRDTIFDYDHYHSTTHEALGAPTGYGTLLLSGPTAARSRPAPATRSLSLGASGGRTGETSSNAASDFEVGSYLRPWSSTVRGA